MRHIRLAPLWSDIDPELASLLHPASAFDHPQDVVRDPDLTTEEKRAILSSWASDACAVESQPALRLPPGAKQPVGLITSWMRSGVSIERRFPNGSVCCHSEDPAVRKTKTAASL